MQEPFVLAKSPDKEDIRYANWKLQQLFPTYTKRTEEEKETTAKNCYFLQTQS
jgi:hypothetical protein